jgi:cyanophycinase
MTGILALQGGGPFVANDQLDRRIIDLVGATRVVVLPTADAFEHPERLVAASLTWGERLGVEVEALMVMRRAEAAEPGSAVVLADARAVYLVGDSQLHLRSVLKETPLWDAIGAVLARGGAVVGVGGSASALCDPMVDPRGGAFALGLGLVPGMAFVSEAETFSADRMHRTLALANTPVACSPTGTALVRRDGVWETVGDVDVRGDLP